MVNFGTKLTSLCGIVIIKTWLQLPEKKKELPGRAGQNKRYYCGVSVSVVAMHAKVVCQVTFYQFQPSHSFTLTRKFIKIAKEQCKLLFCTYIVAITASNSYHIHYN